LPLAPIDADAIAEHCQIVFLTLPDGEAQTLVPTLRERQLKVIDLSADYRFSSLERYQSYYEGDRSDYDLLSQVVYGLPELYRSAISRSSLVGCAGSYPTASLLAIAPLIKQGLVQPESLIIDAKCGTSVGGNQPKPHLLYVEAADSIAPYSVTRHRHTPEIEQICSDLAGHDIVVQFIPHRVPVVRGLLSTVYANMRDPGLVREDLLTIYSAFYRNSPWIRVLSNGLCPQTRWAMGSNLCYLGIEVDPRTGRVVVMAAIDNLMKGAVGQAVQCCNIMMGWDERLGLPSKSLYP
ncbi:MAG: N-acetyl-gamma-glutamyl-phosphate reductase, partial [Cyanobacteria bacterium P01_D01_bin.128]